MDDHDDIRGVPADNTPAAIAGPRRSRARRFSEGYGLVLILLIATFFVTAGAGDRTAGRVVALLTLATTTWLALRISQVQRTLLRIAVALIPLVTLAGIVLIVIGNDDTAKLVTAALTVLLVLVAPAAILHRLIRHPVVNVSTFYGAVCVYLLIAMFFASAFGLIAAVQHEPFFAQVDSVGAVDYLYFSLTTITTTGYGDLTAAHSVGRMTAVFEAVLGQLYLITVVALVVNNLGQSRRDEKRIL